LRILYFINREPYPEDTGDAVRILNSVRNLSADYEPYLLYFGQSEPHEEVTDNFKQVFMISEGSTDKLVRRIKKGAYILPPAPRNNWKLFTNHHVHKKLSHIIRRHNIDLIHSYGPFLSSVCSLNFSHVPKVVDICDSMTLKYRREIANSDISSNIKNRYYSYYYNRLEKILIEDNEEAVVISQPDAEAINKTTGKDVNIIPNGVDAKYFSPRRPDIINDKLTLVFFGNYNFQPNNQAVDFIVEELYEGLKNMNIDFRILLVGPNPPRIEKEQIEVTGWVEDLPAYLNNSDIAIMPFFSGSGMKNKVLEAMAMELPVITTPVGAEAFSREVKSVLLIESTRRGMLNHIRRLSNSPKFRKEIGQNGRDAVKTQYSWRSTAQKFEKVYNKAVGVRD